MDTRVTKPARAMAHVVLVLAAFTLTACIAPSEPTPFAFGRWESADGEYFLDIGGDEGVADYRLPVDPDQFIVLGCDGGYPGPTEGSSEWSRLDSLDGIYIDIVGVDGAQAYGLVLSPRYRDDWATLELLPCGSDDGAVSLQLVTEAK